MKTITLTLNGVWSGKYTSEISANMAKQIIVMLESKGYKINYVKGEKC